MTGPMRPGIRRADCRAALLATGLALCLGLPAAAVADLPTRAPRAPLVELARAQVGVDRVWVDHGVTGAGATLCLVDTGVDPTLSDFRDATNASRIRYQFEPGAAPRGTEPELERLAGGAVWRGEELGALDGDTHGHGTAMAAIALGDDAGEDEATGPGAGMAPGASLIVVRAFDAEALGFMDDAVVQGIRFCRLAAERDETIDARRLVVLLSLGGHDGAHDSASAFERAIVREAAGAPVVVAAGNDGGRPVRAAGRVTAGEIAVVEIGVPRAGIADGTVTITLATQGEYSVRGPLGARTPWRRTGREADTATLDDAQIRIEPVDDRAGVARLVLGADRARAFALEVRGPATFECWLASTRVGPTFFSATVGGRFVRSDELITIPATAQELIAVGASVNRGASGEASETASFSAPGPTITGRAKPDLIAPGDGVRARLSSQVDPLDPTNLIGGRTELLTDGRVTLRGTSTAAAVVAGALLLALSLDAEPRHDARELLIASADGEEWTPRRGYGELNVPALLARWTGAEVAPTELRLSATRPFALTDGPLFLTGRGDGYRQLGFEAEGVIWTAPLREGVLETSFGPRGQSVGDRLEVHTSSDGVAGPTLFIPIVFDRGAPGELRPSGGACAVGASSPWRAPPLVWSVLALAIRSRRRRRGR